MLYNRELSWLSFNYRVLQEAASDTVPLFERLKFLSIFSSNLDEFFRVRYPAVLALQSLKKKTQKQLLKKNWDDSDIAMKIQDEISRQLKEYGTILLNDILPALDKNDIHLYYNEPLKEEHRDEVTEIFLSKVLSFIQPVLLDGKRNFIPENNQLYYAIALKRQGEELIRHAIVNIPSSSLPRFFTLASINNKQYVIFIDDIIRENIHTIFPGFEIESMYSFKINRDAELKLEEEYEADLVEKIEKQLGKRDFGPPSRFLYEGGMPTSIKLFLASALSIKLDEMFEGGRYHNLKDLAGFPAFQKPLVYEKREPLLNGISRSGDIFNAISQKDILVHLPYQSYNPILTFFNQAAIDPGVSEIFIAFYRVAPESHIANALMSAAKNGKRVTVFLELKARFDEANNIRWSRKMKDAGVKIIYSIPGIKVHSKIALVKKKAKEGSALYSVLSTGNFNEITAKFYTDHVLFTADEVIGKELDQLFDFLQKRRLPVNNTELKFDKLLVSQFNMVDRFNELIKQEIKKVKKGGTGLIRIKLNNLEEPAMINTLYKASQAGVKIHLIIRSICCLVPQEKDLSENIEVRRIVDRYLEHSRIFIFGEGEDESVVIGSADWMIRNLHRRIEVCVPVTNEDCKKELVDYFELQWNETNNEQQAIYNYIKEKT